MGGMVFTLVGMGGLDLNGAGKGFDLDAVPVRAVPEPETCAMMMAGPGVFGWLARRTRST